MIKKGKTPLLLCWSEWLDRCSA